MTAAAPFDAIPVYVRAGSIIPFGPELQYADEKAADPITLCVYPGADGQFTLYEDDGGSYRYEQGECSRIAFRWDEAARTLTIGPRTGVYPGMLARRTFRIVLATTANPTAPDSAPDRMVAYQGNSIRLLF